MMRALIILLMIFPIAVFSADAVQRVDEQSLQIASADAVVAPAVSTAPARPVIQSHQSYSAPDTTSALLKVTLGLGLVVAAIFGSAWAFKRFAGTAFIANDTMKIISGLSLGTRDRIVLIQVGDEQIVVGISPGRIQTLHVLKYPVDVSTENSVVGSAFSERLNAVIKQWKR
ncbi:MAG: flagellar biosynthetic protein FliO [Gammaproteobacteria bacterium]|nr:flagellar biosynthetic protein FliO [Gammaproteobacteria bacterium]